MSHGPAIALIGMPGAGKSTVGHWLASHLQLPFIDTDRLIEARAGQALQALINTQGVAALLQRENEVLAALPAQAAIIATGGSAVYCEAGMAHLRQQALVVYLRCDLDNLALRIDNPQQRGIVMAENQSLATLFDEREPLYRRYADLAVETQGKTPEQVGLEICRHFSPSS